MGIRVHKTKSFAIAFFISLFFASLAFAQGKEEGELKMKKIVMIIPQNQFRDDELSVPKEMFKKNNIEVKVASLSLDYAKGMLGAKVKPDMLFSDINLEDFDALVFVGGMGADVYWDDAYAHKLAKDAVSNNKIVAAICIAPMTLAKAGILNGRRATISSYLGADLRSMGINYAGEPVVRDGNIITASGPDASLEFAKEIIRALNK